MGEEFCISRSFRQQKTASYVMLVLLLDVSFQRGLLVFNQKGAQVQIQRSRSLLLSKAALLYMKELAGGLVTHL